MDKKAAANAIEPVDTTGESVGEHLLPKVGKKIDTHLLSLIGGGNPIDSTVPDTGWHKVIWDKAL